MPARDRKYAVGATTGLTTTRQAIQIHRATSTDALSQNCPPTKVHVHKGRMKAASIAGGCTTIIWFVAADAAGNVPLTDEFHDTITLGVTTTSGGIVRELAITEPGHEDVVIDSFYIVARTDAGTCSASPYLYFTGETGDD